MSSTSKVIRGGTVVNAEGERKADVVIVGETIVEVGPNVDVTVCDTGAFARRVWLRVNVVEPSTAVSVATVLAAT